MNEQFLPSATYGYDGSRLSSDIRLGLVAQIDIPEQAIPFPIWDPDNPSLRPSRFSKYSRPITIELSEGDMLYLPALWYHKVSQLCSHERICCSVNYW